jgi:hypothetical protein
MRSIVLLCGVLTAAVAAFAQTPSPKQPSPFDQQLIANQKQFLQAYVDKNATQVNQAIAGDFKGIGTNGDFYDREEPIASAQEGWPKDTRSYDFQVVKLDEDCAVVAYNMVVPGGHPRYRHMADTWTKIDGQWKLKFQQITPNLWSAKDFD